LKTGNIYKFLKIGLNNNYLIFKNLDIIEMNTSINNYQNMINEFMKQKSEINEKDMTEVESKKKVYKKKN
jgi:hypothetical protein